MAPAILPFRGIRYDWGRGRLAARLCPPYDVISEALARELRARPLNAIHVELPAGAPAVRYRRAAGLWRRWLGTGVLVEEREPCFYAVEQGFVIGGARRRRRGLLAGLSLAPSSLRRVMAHERTYPKPKAERLRQVTALKAFTSPVFLVHGDPSGEVGRVLEETLRAPAEARGRTTDGTIVRVRRVASKPDIAAIQGALRGATLLVADGHHRLEVAKEYQRRRGEPGSAAALVYLCCEEDPGLVVLPTHRVLADRRLAEKVLDAIRSKCRLEPCRSAAALSRALDGRGPGAFGIIAACGLGRRKPELALASPAARAGSGKAGGGAQRRGATLALEWLHCGPLAGLGPQELTYTHSAREAGKLALKSGGLALLVAPLAVPEIIAAVRRSGVLPQKSTYFVPKIGAGIVFKKA